MTQWYSKELGDGVEAYAPSNRIQEIFLPLFVAAGQPTDMAAFSRYDSERNLVTIYFSPRASVLAKIFDAIPCEKPKNKNGLVLLVGDQSCLKHFYPSS